jgi:G:T-mismatch repair DNA endonuclease (very short patch repair protein)
MSITKYDLLSQLDYTSWETARKTLNIHHGFFEATDKVKEINKVLTYNIKASEASFVNMHFSVRNSTEKTLISTFKMFVKTASKKARLFFSINDIEYTAGAINFFFNCKFCSKTMKIEGNPKRGVSDYFDCYLCKNCKNSIIHKCEDYKLKFKKVMKVKYGVETSTPFKIPQVRKQITDTMVKRYGVPYSGLSASLLRKTWSKWKNKAVASAFEMSVSDFVKTISTHEVFTAENPHIIEIDKKTFIPDIAIPELKLIFECFGDYWHGNPNLFNEDQIIASGKFTRKECNEKDQKRIKTIEDKTGFVTKVIWENSWKTKRAQVEKEIREAINERISLLSAEKSNNCES